MQIDFDGKVILVTGSSKGLGLSFGKCLDQAGAKVVLNGRAPYSEELATNFEQAGIDSFYVSCPVELSEELISQVIDKFGRIDGLVHNAGFLRDKTLKKMSDADWFKVLEAHLSSAFRLVRSAWPHFERVGAGRIVFLSSATGIYGNFGQANYAAAKLGMLGLAKTIALEGAKSGINCNCVAPFGATSMNSANFPEALKKAINPDYIAPLIAFLSHQSCEESGSMFEASAGSFKKIRFERSRGLNLDPREGAITVDQIAESWSQIVDFSESEYPKSMAESLRIMYERTLE